MLRNAALKQSSVLLRSHGVLGETHAASVTCILTETGTALRALDVMRFIRNHPCPAGDPVGHRGYATELTAGMTLLNKGLKAGPGGRSSVSLITHACRQHVHLLF